MADLSTKLIKAIISTMLIITSPNHHSVNTEECRTIGNALPVNQIGNQLTRNSGIVSMNANREETAAVAGLSERVGGFVQANCSSDKPKLGFPRIFDKHMVLQIRGTWIMRLLKWLKELSGKDDNIVGRCFGVAKRLQFVLPIIIFKLGVIVTILVFLSIFSLKSLGIGVLLLILNVGGFIGKFFALKSHHNERTSADHHSSIPTYIPIPVHTPNRPHYPYHRSHNPPSQIHLHIHNKEPDTHPHGSYSYHHNDIDTDGSSYSYHNPDGAASSTNTGTKSIAHALFSKYASHASKGVDDYEPYASGSATSPYGYYTREYPPTAWTSRVGESLEGSTSEAERRELLALYKRLGFDIRGYLADVQQA